MIKNKAEHAKQPKLCPKCEKVLIRFIASGETQGFEYCTHNRALGVVEGGNGKVVSWVIWGQVTRGEAHRLIAQMDAMLPKEPGGAK